MKIFILLLLIDVVYFSILIFFAKNNMLRCHKRKCRSYKFMRNHEARICSRCFSMYLGIGMFPLIYLVVEYNTIWQVIFGLIISITLQVPLFTDGITQLKKIRRSNNTLRTITGILSGVGLANITIIFLNLFIF